MSDDTKPPERIDATLVAAGRYHDIDFARRELLGLLGEHDHVRVRVTDSYADTEAIAASRFLVTYTCDLRPTEAEQQALRTYVEGGGRWLALHGTNSVLDFTEKGVAAPEIIDTMAFTLGSQFIAHPPIQPYTVECCAPEHPLVKDIPSFETDDELYLCRYHEKDELIPLLSTHYAGDAAGFVESDWSDADEHLIMYLRPLGQGAVLYNTLGHCRGHWDMRPAMDYYPQVERCSWEKPEYYELLRRSLRWCLEA